MNECDIANHSRPMKHNFKKTQRQNNKLEILPTDYCTFELVKECLN